MMRQNVLICNTLTPAGSLAIRSTARLGWWRTGTQSVPSPSTLCRHDVPVQLRGLAAGGENRGRFTVASFILLSTTTWAETIATNLGNDGGRHPRCANWAESDVLNRPAPVRLHQNGIVHVTDIAIDGGIVPAFNRQHPVTGQAYDRELPSNRVLAAGRSAIWRNNSMASPIIACGGFRSSRKLRSVDSSSPVIARQLPTRWINVGSPSDGWR